MKLQIISINDKNSGFLMIEMIIAISLFTLFMISIYSYSMSINSLKIWSINELEILKNSVKLSDDIINNLLFNGIRYGNDSKIISINPFTFVKSNLIDSWGGLTCNPRIKFDQSKIVYYPNGLFLGNGNNSTDIDVRNSIVYLSTNSSTQSQPDFFIIDSHDPNNLKQISSLDTGPGVSSLVVAGPYVYLANTSSLSQLQIIDIHNRNSPYIISQLKLKLPTASSTPPRSTAIYYKNKFIYLGTNKWDGPELSIIDVSDPLNPTLVGSFKTDTLINDIFVYDNFVYLATSDASQMRILNISDKTDPRLISSFKSNGWEVQQGKVISLFEDTLVLGRTVGGINRINNHEIFIFSTTTDRQLSSSNDIPGGVYGLLIRLPFIYIITHSINEEFQVWDSTFKYKIYEKSLLYMPVSMVCDWSNLYFATGNENGLSILSL